MSRLARNLNIVILSFRQNDLTYCGVAKLLTATMTLNNFKRRKRRLCCHATFAVVILVLLLNQSSVAAASDEDYDEEEINLAPNLNCFSLVDENSWSRILRLDHSNGVLTVQLNNTGPRVITCLQGKVVYLYVIFYSMHSFFALPGWCHAGILKKRGG